MLSALHRKLLRDLWHLKSQAVAISLVMACGVATFVMSVSTASSMYRNQARFYEQFRFADVFVNLKRAPASLAPRLAAVPGVARLETRVVAQVNLDVPGMIEPAQGLADLAQRSCIFFAAGNGVGLAQLAHELAVLRELAGS